MTLAELFNERQQLFFELYDGFISMQEYQLKLTDILDLILKKI